MALRPLLLPLGAALLAMFGSAAQSGLLVPNAEASFTKKRENEDGDEPPLLLTPADEAVGDALIGHRSHSSHRSHASHASHYSGSSGRYPSGDSDDGGGNQPAYEPPPPPPKPAVVSFVALPGGRIFIDGKLVGMDSTPPMALKAGGHKIVVENRFLDPAVVYVELTEGQTGVVNVEW
jgi:hypothetical protein